MRFLPVKEGRLTGYGGVVLLFLLLLWLAGCTPKRVVYIPVEQRQAYSMAGFTHRAELLYRQWQGVPWRSGGSDRSGIDCSAFTRLAMERLLGLQLPRTVKEQEQVGLPVAWEELQPGDLLFFRTGWLTRHVGLYLGEGRFLHASTSRGVTISVLTVGGHRSWWGKRFRGGRRIGTI